MENVVSVFRSKILKLHTTRSWDFLGLPLYDSEVTPLQLTYGHDVVVGIFDTGIKSAYFPLFIYQVQVNSIPAVVSSFILSANVNRGSYLYTHKIGYGKR